MCVQNINGLYITYEASFSYVVDLRLGHEKLHHILCGLYLFQFQLQMPLSKLPLNGMSQYLHPLFLWINNCNEGIPDIKVSA